MKAVAQTRTMMTLLNEKLGRDLERLETAFATKDLTLLNEATKQLNLYAQRAYDLTVSGTHYARFKQSSRREFFEMIQDDFKEHGIEIVLPQEKGYSGDAIYFKAFGERLAVLYGEHHGLTGEFRKGNTAFLSLILEGHKERYQAEMEKVKEFDERLDVLQRLYDKPALILTDEFASERKASKSVLTFRFHNERLQRAYEKSFAGLIDRQIGKQLLKEMQLPKSRERHVNQIAFIQTEKDRLLETMEQYEARIQELEEKSPAFETVINSFFTLIEKYNMPYTGRND